MIIKAIGDMFSTNFRYSLDLLEKLEILSLLTDTYNCMYSHGDLACYARAIPFQLVRPLLPLMLDLDLVPTNQFKQIITYLCLERE